MQHQKIGQSQNRYQGEDFTYGDNPAEIRRHAFVSVTEDFDGCF